MASGPTTSRQTDGEKETETDFIFLVPIITTYNDYSHAIKRHLLFRRKTMTNLGSILKSGEIALLTKVHIVKAMAFPVVTDDVRVGPQKVQSAKELMSSNCGAGEDS